MPKFNVTLKERETFFIEGVEADTDELAIDKAWDLLEENGKHTYSDDLETESDVEEVDE